MSHEALRDHANRVQRSGTDGAVFEAYRELIEELASAAYDAEAPFDDHGRVLVTSECRKCAIRSKLTWPAAVRNAESRCYAN